jgi:DNA-binding transcriptional LysR family regulator
MPPGHPLAAKSIIRAEDLQNIPFISFKADSYTGQMIAQMFEKCRVTANIALTADAGPTVCEFVAAGFGVSILHPLFIAGMEDRLTVRPFEPRTPLDFQICYARDARNVDIISEFVRETKAMARDFTAMLARGWH